MNTIKRVELIDGLRSIAVYWMIIFHTAYDLRLLGFTETDFSSGFWYAFPRVIAGSFLFVVGISLHLAYSQGINWSKFWRRQMKVGIGAVIISIVTYFIFPTNWIYFGTLHCIFFCTLFGLFFVGKRALIVAALIIMAILMFMGFDIFWVSNLLQKPSLDFIPVYPWFFCTLLGLFVASFEGFWKFVHNCRTPLFLTLPGRHSLKIYLLHQPIIFGVLTLIKNLK